MSQQPPTVTEAAEIDVREEGWNKISFGLPLTAVIARICILKNSQGLYPWYSLTKGNGRRRKDGKHKWREGEEWRGQGMTAKGCI